MKEKKVSSCCGVGMYWSDGIIIACEKCGKECTPVSINMSHTPKKTCDCAETSCPKGCTKQHTHKTFFCETCNPPDATPKEEEI